MTVSSAWIPNMKFIPKFTTLHTRRTLAQQRSRWLNPINFWYPNYKGHPINLEQPLVRKNNLLPQPLVGSLFNPLDLKNESQAKQIWTIQFAVSRRPFVLSGNFPRLIFKDKITNKLKGQLINVWTSFLKLARNKKSRDYTKIQVY